MPLVRVVDRDMWELAGEPELFQWFKGLSGNAMVSVIYEEYCLGFVMCFELVCAYTRLTHAVFA